MPETGRSRLLASRVGESISGTGMSRNLSRGSATLFVWMIRVNGFILDVRDAPYEIQQEAYNLKLIPYIPGCKNIMK